jgi:hypothetical protein
MFLGVSQRVVTVDFNSAKRNFVMHSKHLINVKW